MARRIPHRKRVKHYHLPGEFHEVAFSCYRRLPLLTNDLWRRWLAESIDEAADAHEFHLNAFGFMPEHVHLLIWPTGGDTTADDISTFLADVKRPVSRRVKAAHSRSMRTCPGCTFRRGNCMIHLCDRDRRERSPNTSSYTHDIELHRTPASTGRKALALTPVAPEWTPVYQCHPAVLVSQRSADTNARWERVG